MKKCVAVVVLLSLLSLGRSAPLSSCDHLVKPITVSNEDVSALLLFFVKNNVSGFIRYNQATYSYISRVLSLVFEETNTKKNIFKNVNPVTISLKQIQKLIQFAKAVAVSNFNTV